MTSTRPAAASTSVTGGADDGVTPRPDPAAANRRADIQGLRAVAVVLVVAFHAGLPLTGGFVGVDVFFVISGFVITAMLARELTAAGRIRFTTFYLRRFLRLTPALALTVGVVAVASFLLQNPFGAQQTTAQTGLGAMLLSANYVIGAASGDYFAVNAVTNPLLNTWSLSVEEQFYLVFPALLALGWLLARRAGRREARWAPVAVVSAIALASFALSLAWSSGSAVLDPVTAAFGGPETFAFYSSVTRAWEFAVGALLALLVPLLPRPGRALARSGAWLGAALVVASGLLLHEGRGFPGWVATVPVAGSALLLWAGVHQAVGPTRLLATRPFVAVGDVSYSWYLWHWPVIVFTALVWPNRPAALVVAAVASLLPALASYRWVEQPLRRLRPRSARQAATVIVPTLAVPIVLCALLLSGANDGWGAAPTDQPVVAAPLAPKDPTSAVPTPTSQPPDPTSPDPTSPAAGPDPDGEVTAGAGGSLRSQHAAVKAGCVNSDFDPVHCRFGAPDAVGTVLLAGDSQAYSVADGAITAAQRLGYDIVVTSHTGCPFLGRESSGKHNYPCRSWQRDVLEYATTQRPDLVVIANRSAGYVHPEWDYRTAARDDGSAATSESEAQDLWRRGLTPVVRDIVDAGVPVLFVAAVPEMTGYEVRSSVLDVGEPFTVDRGRAERDRASALAIEQELVDRFGAVSIFDPNPSLCGPATCAADGPDGPVYQDETHLSLAGSLRLTDRFSDAIADAIGKAAADPVS